MNGEAWLSVLNPEQKAAVIHEGSPLLILAGAGSGKTRVITTKIAWLIAERNVAPESILAVTFTNKAAREMVNRATRMESRAENSVIRTFHSFGAWLLRRNAALAGLDSNFTIYDDDDAVVLLSKAIPALTRQQVSAAVRKIARAKDYCLTPESSLLSTIDPDPDFADVYGIYQKRLRETGNLDFGDLIMLPVQLLNEHPEVRSRLISRFSVVMVDEYQDSNVAQFELLKALTGPETYVCVVGDDDQSIYRFRGAEVRNILTFQDSFPGTSIIRLERNYRSFSPILSVASQVVSQNEGRLGKTLIAERGKGKKPQLVFIANQEEEAALCAQLVQDAHSRGCPYDDWAILYRMNAQSLSFETEFLHRRIPYKVVGSLKFYDREEIKDALSFLALVVNGRDEVAFRRIVNKPSRGIGEVSRNKIVDEARSILFNYNTQDAELIFDEKTDLISASRRVLNSFPKKARSGLSEFIHIIESLRQLLDSNPEPQVPPQPQPQPQSQSQVPPQVQSQSDLQGAEKKVKGAIGLAIFVERLVEASGLLSYHQGQDEIAGTQRVSNLQELVNAASLYPLNKEGLVEFLEHIDLDRSLANEDENPDSVTLITVHNTKGLEFRRVVVTGLEHGVFPREDKTGDDLEEERRLMYVACTRAMDELYLTSCAARRLYGRTLFVEPSPFLTEINTEELDIHGRVPRSFNINISGHSAGIHAGSRSVGQSLNTNGTGENAGKKADPLAEKWKMGQKLFHDDYGYGSIVKSFYAKDELIIMVHFESGGEMRFMPKFQAHSLLLVEDTH
ncbi:MAG TPA: ATP-dependent helicase [Treponemataceae bacterium]|nr:ATP-dependent helicase [Treponemataceae bacterium]